MTNICYIIEADFSRPNASTSRVVNNTKALTADRSIRVDIIGYGDESEYPFGDYLIKNIPRGNTPPAKLYNYFMRGVQTVRLLKRMAEKPDAIIYYGATARYLLPLLRYARRNGIKIIADVAEWYDYASLPLRGFSPETLNIYAGMHWLTAKCDGIIAISSYLANYYKAKGIPVLTVPVLIDTEVGKDMEPISDPVFREDHTNLIYAGVPGKKDLIVDVIRAVDYLQGEGIPISLHLLGPTEAQIQQLGFRKQSPAIIYHGRIPQGKIISYLKKADYSILLRPDKRYAHAGFPTKFAESLNAALPVIANITGDIAKYLKDGYNGFIIKDYRTPSLTEQLKNIANTPKKETLAMRNNARQTALQSFDYHLFSREIADFVK